MNQRRFTRWAGPARSLLKCCAGPLAVCCTLLGLHVSAAQGETLRPEDKLRLDIPGLQSSAAAIAIEPDGYVTFPYVGSLMAAGKTLAELNTEVGFGLVDKSATIIRPDGSPMRVPLAGIDYRLTVAQYAPIVLGGMVENPGQYPFRPGMTVQKAIALAGGVEVPLTDQSVTATSLAQLNSSIGQALAESAAIAASQWRLAIFLENNTPDTQLTPPEGVSAAAFASLLDVEHARLEEQREIHAQRAALLAERTEVLQTLSQSLQKQIAALKDEHSASEGEVQRVSALFERGLTPQTTVLEAQRRARLDFIAVSDAEQDLAEATLDVLQAQSEFNTFEQTQRRQALDERAQLLRSKMANDTELVALQSMAAALGIELGDTFGKIVPKVTIYRDAEILEADQLTATTQLVSGDFVQVELSTVQNQTVQN